MKYWIIFKSHFSRKLPSVHSAKNKQLCAWSVGPGEHGKPTQGHHHEPLQGGGGAGKEGDQGGVNSFLPGGGRPAGARGGAEEQGEGVGGGVQAGDQGELASGGDFPCIFNRKLNHASEEKVVAFSVCTTRKSYENLEQKENINKNMV